MTHHEISTWNIINSIISYSHSDSDVMVLRPEIIIILFEDICVLISSKVTRNRVTITVIIGYISSRMKIMNELDGI